MHTKMLGGREYTQIITEWRTVSGEIHVAQLKKVPFT